MGGPLASSEVGDKNRDTGRGRGEFDARLSQIATSRRLCYCERLLRRRAGAVLVVARCRHKKGRCGWDNHARAMQVWWPSPSRFAVRDLLLLPINSSETQHVLDAVSREHSSTHRNKQESHF